MNFARPVDEGALFQRPTRRPRGRRQPVLAAIDLGSNNCRLLIAEPRSGQRFRVLESFSRTVRLAEGVARTGCLSDAAIARAVAALVICASRIRRYGNFRLRAIATEACRRASNVQDLLNRVREEAGISLDIITADEEARLAAIGCAPLMGDGYEGALVFDIGGGSTELIWLEADEREPVYAVSLPVGVVNVTESFGDAPIDQMEQALQPRFAEVAVRMKAVRPFRADGRHLLGTSGTVTTLAALALGLRRYDRDRVDGSWHESRQIREVVEKIAALDLAGRADLNCIGPERADLVLAGCAIFNAIHAHWPCERLRVADRGLREGLIRELMRQSST